MSMESPDKAWKPNICVFVKAVCALFMTLSQDTDWSQGVTQHDFNSLPSLKVYRPVLSWSMWDKFVASRDTCKLREILSVTMKPLMNSTLDSYELPLQANLTLNPNFAGHFACKFIIHAPHNNIE